MKFKVRVFSLCVLCVLLSSCFNGLMATRETTVSFYMDEATVNKILQKSGRAAADIYDSSNVYIDVTLCSDVEQTKTDAFSSDVKIEFQNILVGTRVYAKAQIYEYEDSAKTIKNVFYRGESSKIIVSEGTNVLTLRLGTAELTVTFESNEGTAIEPVKVMTGNSIQEPETPIKPVDKKKYSKENYAFAGWCKDEECTKTYNFALPVKDDLTLYAKWLPDFVFVQGSTINNYLATGRNLKTNDLFVSDHEVTQAEYQEVTNENPSNNKKTDDKASEYPVENVTWFDAIKYCNLLSVKEGLTPCYKIDDSTDPKEWENLSATTQVVCTLSANGYRLPTEAEWEYISTKSYRYNIDFDSMVLYSQNSGDHTNEVDNRRADELGLCNVLGNVAEWCFDVYSSSISKTTGPTGPMASDSSTERVVRGGSYQSYSSDCTPQTRSSANPTEKSDAIGFRVVRSAINEFKVIKNTVTFQTNGGSSVDVQSIVDGDCATQPADPTRTGYEFKGWIYDGATFDFSTPITMDVVIEAKWQPITYTISYDLDGGAETTANPTSYTIETETFELRNPTKTNYNFKGWFDGSNKITKIEKGSYGNLSLTAHWTQCHIVTFDLQDGSTPTEQEVENNETATRPTDPEKTGFTFVRWYDATGSDDDDFDFTTPITGNVSLKALWQYKVTYDSSSGTAVNAQTYKQTEAVTAPTAPTRTGFTFDCWCEDSADGPEYTFGNVSSTGNITLYARWKYTVTYDSNGGSAVSGMTSIHTVPITKPSDPLWSGYVFDCWCSDAALTNEFTFGSPPENGDITLYARWTYQVVFYTDGGSNVPLQSGILFTEAPTLPDPAPTKTNYEFEYWCTDLSDPENTKYEFDDPLSGMTTLMAKFKPVEQNLGTITVTLGEPVGDIDVDINTETNTVTYTADSGYDSYCWIFDGDETHTVYTQVFDTAETFDTQTLVVNTTNLISGVYDVYLEAEKDGEVYTWTHQITK